MKHQIKFSVAPNNSEIAGEWRRGLSSTSGIAIKPVFSTKLEHLSKDLLARATLENFKGAVGQTILSATTRGGGKLQSQLVFGLGESEKFDIKVWREALIGAFKKAATLRSETVFLIITNDLFRALQVDTLGNLHDLTEIGQVTATTIEMVLYQPNSYKTKAGGLKDKTRINSVCVFAEDLTDDDNAELWSGIQAGAILGTSVNLARDTANEPANICTPTFLERLAYTVAKESNYAIRVEVFYRDRCEALGMNCFMAVAQGTNEAPKFIVLDYHPKGLPADAPILGLVGKGITLDTGGVNLKDAGGMRDMKYDMCGAADVIASMRAIALLELPVHVMGFCPATENKTGPDAFMPGDIFTALCGKTVEIDNTDAEGRLILIDAIAYAIKVAGVSKIVDFATLTGAVIVALGDVFAGVVSNNKEWCNTFMTAADTAGESMWQLPTHPDFKKQNESKIADLKNTGGKGGGSITAGMFVMEAAGDVPIVHCDIAGVANRGRATGADPEGATGFGVLTTVELAKLFGASA